MGRLAQNKCQISDDQNVELNNFIHWTDIDPFPHSQWVDGALSLSALRWVAWKAKCTQPARSTHHTEAGPAELEEVSPGLKEATLPRAVGSGT